MKKRIFLGCILCVLLFCSPSFSQDSASTLGQFLSAGAIVYYQPPGHNQNVRGAGSEYQQMIVLGKDTPILKIVQTNDSGIAQILIRLDATSEPVHVWVLRTNIEKKK